MNTPASYGKGSVRWRYISAGYTKYWYLRSALRWLSIVSSVTALIIFGIVYHTYADYKHIHTLYLGTILFIVAVSEFDSPFCQTRKPCLLSATATFVVHYKCYRSHSSFPCAKEVFRQSWMVAIWRPHKRSDDDHKLGLQRTVHSRLVRGLLE